jgi:putative MFS transporter
VGLATSVGRIGGVLAPLMVGMLVQREVAISLIFTIFFVTILIGAAAVLFLGRETKGQELAE